jgi:hypothetical protein
MQWVESKVKRVSDCVQQSILDEVKLLSFRLEKMIRYSR